MMPALTARTDEWGFNHMKKLTFMIMLSLASTAATYAMAAMAAPGHGHGGGAPSPEIGAGLIGLVLAAGAVNDSQPQVSIRHP